MCAGCLEDKCIHVRKKSSKVDHSAAGCLFGKIHDIEESCPVRDPHPPEQFALAEPSILEDAIRSFVSNRDELTEQPPTPEWPLLIPEVSDITETTSRLGVWPDEGDWSIPRFDPIAWDMTGYLFDKIQGAPWVFESERLEEEDWHSILGPHEHDNWIQNILMVDRLPDLLAIQTPPTAIMVAYMNRLWSYQWPLLDDEDAPRPWLVTHGYPSYIDWPPAWHWNLGIRMLSSLTEYLSAQAMGSMGPSSGAIYPDGSRETVVDIRVPFVKDTDKTRLMWKPESISVGPTEMDWDYFPGIIPFVPGADTHQLLWFAKQILKLGFPNLAIDAVNSIANENFRGIPEAISTLHRAGAEHVFVYGPWPLHPPSKYMSKHKVSYIPTASHMDLTNTPARYWRSSQETDTKPEWKRLPSYRKKSLASVAHNEGVELCKCGACKSGVTKEIDPRSIWRWGHLLLAGEKWSRRPDSQSTKSPPQKNTRLWYQGPSYTVFRKCLYYSPEVRWKGIEDILDSLTFDETRMEVKLHDGVTAPAESIHWTSLDELHVWADEFPSLEG
jgi:hypothetical protein